ncbi:MAG: hypothetical protein V3U93_02015 [Alphaproteobacteria bacterium]
MCNLESSSKETLENETLGALAEKIARYATEADEKTLEAAKLVGEARKRIEAGDAGDINWYSWAKKNIKLSMSRLRELQCIAEAEDPQKELRRQRKVTQKRVERYREKKKSAPLRNGGASVSETAELEEDRKSLIKWARDAPIERVAEMLAYIQQYDSAETVSDSGQSAVPYAT